MINESRKYRDKRKKEKEGIDDDVYLLGEEPEEERIASWQEDMKDYN